MPFFKLSALITGMSQQCASNHAEASTWLCCLQADGCKARGCASCVQDAVPQILFQGIGIHQNLPPGGVAAV